MRCLREIQGATENDDGVNSKIHSKAAVERFWRFTRKWKLSAYRHTLGGLDWVDIEMHWEILIEWVWGSTWEIHHCANLDAEIEPVWEYPWRPWSREFRDTLGDSDWASCRMHLEAIIKGVWRDTWRLWSIEIRRVLGGGRWTAHRMLSINLSGSQLPTIRMWQADLTWELSCRAGQGRSMV